MATKTLILRPTSLSKAGASFYEPTPADVEPENRHVLVAEDIADDDATYLTCTGLVPAAGFNFGKSEISNLASLQPSAVRVIARMCTTVANSGAIFYYRAEPSSLEPLETIWLTELYETYVQEIPPEHLAEFWEYLVSALDESTDYTIALGSTTPSSSGKASREVRITQLYLEVDYEEDFNKEFFYLKIDNKWLPIDSNSIYKKINGVWQLDSQSIKSLSTKFQWGHYYLAFTELEGDTYSVKATDITTLPTTVSIPKTYSGKLVTAIAPRAFEYAPIVQVQIPDSIKTIDEYAFHDSSLTSVDIPNSVETLNAGAFLMCTELTKVRLPDGLSILPSWCFSYCTALTTLTLPDTLTRIEYGALEGCSSLTSLAVPSSVTFIDHNAFGGCSGLTSIELPEQITKILANTFEYCTSLETITFSSDLTDIGSYAFNSCESLKTIVIPASVETIGEHAFTDCNNLTIYCESAAKPEGWSSTWNASARPVLWGYTGLTHSGGSN